MGTLYEQKAFPFVIGMDLGGTKVAIGAVDTLKDQVVYQEEMATFGPCDKKMETQEEVFPFLSKLAQAVKQVVLKTSELGGHFEGRVGVGFPGAILDGVMRPDTTPQLGVGLNNFPIQKELHRALAEVLPLTKCIVLNDALAQMSYGVADLLHKEKKYRTLLHNQKIAYIGPGTGLGGGFASLQWHEESQKVSLDFFTDGHIGDIIMGYHADGSPSWAEFDYLSGLYIEKKTSLTGKDIALRLDEFRPFVRELGLGLGKIIEKIYRGDVYKARNSTLWSDHDREMVKGIAFYIMGGSIGTKGEMGEIIRHEAQNYLSSLSDLPSLQLIPVIADSSDIGLLGAAQFVLME